MFTDVPSSELHKASIRSHASEEENRLTYMLEFGENLKTTIKYQN
jgi:hypothetical protein